MRKRSLIAVLLIAALLCLNVASVLAAEDTQNAEPSDVEEALADAVSQELPSSGDDRLDEVDEIAAGTRETINIENNNYNTNTNWGGSPGPVPGYNANWAAPYMTTPTTVGALVSKLSGRMQPKVLNSNGQPKWSNAAVATGDILVDANIYGLPQAVPIIVRGDVLGTGSLNVAQIVRMARALNGTVPLPGIYLTAGDWNGNGCIDIGDLAREAYAIW